MDSLSELLETAREIKPQRLQKKLQPILAAGEELEQVFRVLRDLLIFTNRRLILVDKQGLTGKKTEYHSLPYRSISHFSVETAGHVDLDSTLKIWLMGEQQPLVKEFRKRTDIINVQKTLAHYILP
ncbi:MAG: PH domain-containing protein [Chloroflexota bacterium]|nr:PH domain-containing protein [Chloroflexota bacterium]